MTDLSIAREQPRDYVPEPIPPGTPLYRLLQRLAEALAESAVDDASAPSAGTFRPPGDQGRADLAKTRENNAGLSRAPIRENNFAVEMSW
ncbi:MAG: hypothetical protein IT427_06115 [Pirellulales bacterium]|nr:hypothetical protein [Pirellulales bacterium]